MILNPYRFAVAGGGGGDGEVGPNVLTLSNTDELEPEAALLLTGDQQSGDDQLTLSGAY